MQGEEKKQGKRRIREYLITPMELLGLTHPRGMNKGQFEKAKKGLEENLAYMHKEAVIRLCLVVRSNLDGKNHTHWPAPAAIYTWARDIQEEPKADSDLVVSWLQSREGPAALDGGYCVELRSDLARFRRPPTQHSLEDIKRRAAKNRHKLVVIKERVAVNRATGEETDWRDAYMTALDHCKVLVNGRATNTEKAEI